MILSGKGKFEGVKITVFETHPCDYLTSPCKKLEILISIQYCLCMCPGLPCPNVLTTPLAMGLLSITSTFSAEIQHRDTFLYRVRTVADTTPCQDNFWYRFLAKWSKTSNRALQEILRTHSTPRFLFQGNAAS